MSLAYLVPEIIFNAQLVSLVGLGTPSEHALEQLEVFGRAISGIGVTLLLADLLPAKVYKTKLRGCISLICLTIIIWPTVYFGQKQLVERLLIEPSTAQQREYAVLSAAMRDALALNAVTVAGLEYDNETLNSSENLTFLALFGGLLYADDTLADNLETHKRDIIKQFVQKQAYRDIDAYYEDFSLLYKNVSEQYSQYAEGSNEYNRILASIPDREQMYWQDIEQQVNQGWQQYQQAIKTYIARAETRAQKYGPKIYEYHRQVNKCHEYYGKYSQRDRRSACIANFSDSYKKEINKAGLGYISPDYWLIEEEVSGLENTAGSILAGVLTAGLFTAVQAVDLATGGDGGMKDKRYKYTDDPMHYQRLILAHPNFHAQFTEDTGYPMSIDSLATFRSHSKTQQRIHTSLIGQGLKLPESWHIGQRLLFAQAVADKVKAEADLRWLQETRKRGLDLPINLNWQAFQLHPSVQNEIKKNMGEMYVHNVRTDWNKANFKQYVLDPNIDKRTQRYLEMIVDARPHFEEGGKYENAGKQALRSVIVPPISMSLSLFLICLTIIKLPVKAFEVFKPHWGKNLSWWQVSCIKSIPVILLIVMPVLVISNQFTANNNSPVNHFLEKVESVSNPVYSFALRWTLHVQPFLHPLGVNLEASTHIYKHVEPYTHSLALIDAKLPTSQQGKESLKAVQEVLPEPSYLIVKTNAKSANIRIMNIKPKYTDNIQLLPGRYDIQIVAPNFKPYRSWHNIAKGKQTLQITLEPK
nr:carboxypeptidase regulatory-like domain-containing protein [Pseudoalteromonas luteoviolacea]